jgi:integrase
MLVTEHGFACGHLRHKRLSREVVRRLLGAVQDDYEFVLVGLGLFLACRASEMPARLWTDVHWESSQVEIWSQVAWNRKTREHYIKKHTKNGVGGTLPVSPEFLEALERLRRKSTRDYILTPNDYDRREFLTRAALRCRFKAIAKRAKLTRLTYMHGLRHTFCCEHADSGLPAHEIQKLARHRKIATTYVTSTRAPSV